MGGELSCMVPLGVSIPDKNDRIVPITLFAIFMLTGTEDIENVVPLYIGEIVYPQSRGFFVACYSLILAAGQIWANGAIQGISKDKTHAGWLIVCGQQLIPAILILAGVSFCR